MNKQLQFLPPLSRGFKQLALLLLAITWAGLFSAKGQGAFTSSWALTSNGNSSTAGAGSTTVTAAALAVGSTITAPTYSNAGAKLKPTGSWQTTRATAKTNNAYVQITIAPVGTSNTISLSSMTYTYGQSSSGSAGIVYMVWAYSTDGGTTFTDLPATLLANATTSGTTTSTQTLTGQSISVATTTGSQSIILRGYQWDTTSASSNSKSGTLLALSFTGATAAIGSTPTVATTGTLTAFGNQVTGSTSTQQSFSVSGSNLTANLVVTPPTGFQISTTSGSGYSSSAINLTPSSGTVAATNIYCVYAPSSASGATGSQNITCASTSATTQNVVVSGNAISTVPTAVGTLTAGTVGPTSVVLNYTAPGSGGGSNVLIVAKAGASTSYSLPANGVAAASGTAAFTTANQVVYNGVTASTGIVTVTGLSAATQYTFTVYEYNGSITNTTTNQDYYATSSSLTQTTATPTISLVTTGFGTFGNQVTTTQSAQQSFTVTGTNLSTNITVTPPSGFLISTTNGSGYAATAITLTPTSGTVASTPIYVVYNPTGTASGATSTNIACTSTGATTQNAPVTGNSIAAEPTAPGTLSFGTLTTTSIIVNVSGGNGSNRVIVGYAGSTPTYAPADGAAPPTATADFSGTDHSTGVVVYSGNGSTVTVTGLTPNTAYSFVDYEYNIGTGTSQNYLTTSPASNSTSTLAAGSPLITTTGSLTAFGNTVTGNNSASQTFSVGGASLTADLIVTPPTGFQISLTNGSGYSSTAIHLTPDGSGNVASTPIYVVFAPASASGTTGSLNIACTSTGATEADEAVTGNAISTAPTAVGSLAAGTVGATSVVLNYTAPGSGGGAYLVIVAKAGATTSYTPANGVATAVGNAAFTTANQVVYNDVTGGNGIVTVTGLTAGTQYTFTVYEYNSGTGTTGTAQNYFATGASFSQTTVTPTVTTTGTLTAFGNVIVGAASSEQSYTVSGSNLSTDITVTAPTGFQVTTTSGSGYASSLTLPQSGGTVGTTTIYAIYSPASATGAASGNITNASAPATTRNVAVSGNAISTEPTATPTLTFGAVTATTAVLNFSGGNGSNHLIVANVATPSTFTLPADGVAPGTASTTYAANGIVYSGTGSTVTVTGLTANTTYYFTEYEYNVGTGTSQNYLSTATTNNTTTSSGTNYYMMTGTITGANIATAANWTTDPSGTSNTGSFAPPSNFTTASQIFHISVTGITASVNWTVSGTNSKIVVDNDFGTANTISGTVDVSASKTFTYSATSGTSLVMGTLASSSTVIYNATSAQTIPGGTYGNLQVIANGGTGSKKVITSLTVNGDLTISAGQSSGFDLSTNGATLTLYGNVLIGTGGATGDNVITTTGNGGNGSIIFAGTSQNIPDAVFSGSHAASVYNMTINSGSTVTLSGTTNVPSITNAFVNNGSLVLGANSLGIATTTAPTGTGSVDASAGTLVMNATNTIPSGFLASGTVKNLTLTSGTATFTGGITVSGGTVTRTAGTLATAPTYSGTVNVSIGAANTSGNEITPASGNVVGLTLTSGTYTLASSPTINGILAISGGSLAVGTNTLTLKGNVTRSGGNITAATGTVVFNGSGAQTVAASSFSGNIGTLTINNASGVTSSSAVVVASALNLTSGLYTGGITEGVTATTSAVNVAGGTLSANPTYAGTVNVTSSGTSTSGKELTPGSGSVNSLTVSAGTYTLASGLNPTWASLSISSGANLVVGTSNITLSATGANISGTFTHANTTGFSGGASTAIKSTNTPVITLNPGSTVVYNGAGTPPVTSGTYANLMINNGGTLSGSTTVNGTLTLNGSLTVGSNTLTIADFAGTSSNSLSVNAGSTITTTGALTSSLFFDGANNTLGVLNIGGNATLGNALNMAASATVGIGTVNVTAGTLTTGGNLTLMSDANGTARIGDLSSGAVSGNVNIQRYIPAQRGYRLIGHPYTGSSVTIATLGQYFDITGITGGNIGPSGSTPCPSTTPSTYIYTPGVTTAYTGIRDASTVVPAAQASTTTANGILAFVRGGTGGLGCANGTSYAVAPTTAFTNGPINQGTITESVVAGGYNIISNPYPSQIIVSGITNSNASGISFITVNPAGQTGGNAYTNGTSYAAASSGTVIPINGAVIAYNASGSDVTFSFSEANSKVPDAASSGLLKTTSVYPTLELSVYNGTAFWDSWSLMMQPGTRKSSGDIGDIPKFTNTQFDIYSFSDNNKSLYRDARDADSVADGDVIHMGLRSALQTNYTIEVSDYSLPGDKTVYLHDKYTNTYLQLSNGVSYPFSVTADTASQGANRMELVFNENNSNTGVGNIANRKGVLVVPNPATSNINVTYSNVYAGVKEISIVNVVGQVVKQLVTAEQAITIPVDNLTNGVYMIRTTVNGNSITERFIKN